MKQNEIMTKFNEQIINKKCDKIKIIVKYKENKVNLVIILNVKYYTISFINMGKFK